jgi:hypothetical protein
MIVHHIPSKYPDFQGYNIHEGLLLPYANLVKLLPDRLEFSRAELPESIDSSVPGYVHVESRF